MKYYLLLISTILVFGLIGCSAKTSRVCAGVDLSESDLCRVSSEFDISLESISAAIKIANRQAIRDGIYTRENIIDRIDTMFEIINRPMIANWFFRDRLRETFQDCPELYDIMDDYFSGLVGSQIMKVRDREILKGWFARWKTQLGG